MKKRPIDRSKPNALDALLSVAIIANNPSTQQAFALLMLFTLRGAME
ncbi:MAG: hypothetical protein RBR82_10150 [Pseudomonas sp.]|nr:hypothetical protein [Pseudomonas sp.]